ncbi:MAG: adenosylcobinamide-GDP ribazoletransferase [Oscillospiraceae bacterium]|jgi:adenosylcobinamide-GDP ribazoletransferase|nr:adenosylcobinamide-GDP ribazoletransferase [Oscillospiraceae bacterium]
MLIDSIRLAFTTFSKIPVGRPAWSGKNMRYLLCAFPLVGVVIGGVQLSWLRLADAFALSDLLRGTVAALLPALLTGGIHLDGFCDTCDALASHAAPERRREILKDPHTGAFAVIGVVIYMSAYLGFASSLPRTLAAELFFCVGFVLSRAVSGFLVYALPPAAEGMAKSTRDAAQSGTERRVAALFEMWFGLCAVAIFFIAAPLGGGVTAGISALLAALVPAGIVRFQALRRFGGMSGDLAGWYLQMAELMTLAAVALVSAFAAHI